MDAISLPPNSLNTKSISSSCNFHIVFCSTDILHRPCVILPQLLLLWVYYLCPIHFTPLMSDFKLFLRLILYKQDKSKCSPKFWEYFVDSINIYYLNENLVFLKLWKLPNWIPNLLLTWAAVDLLSILNLSFWILCFVFLCSGFCHHPSAHSGWSGEPAWRESHSEHSPRW